MKHCTGSSGAWRSCSAEQDAPGASHILLHWAPDHASTMLKEQLLMSDWGTACVGAPCTPQQELLAEGSSCTACAGLLGQKACCLCLQRVHPGQACVLQQ